MGEQSDPRRAALGGYPLKPQPLPTSRPAASSQPASGILPGFRYPLDGSPPRIASGGWTKEVTVRHLPIAEHMSAVHMFLDPGAVRELHWHALAAEWAFVIAGRCQTVVLDPTGASEINNFGPGDLWYFPRNHGHAIQAIGDDPCHFVLSFNNGDESPEVATFGITDWIDVTPKDLLARTFGIPPELFDAFPHGEVYIQAGAIVSTAAATDAPWPRNSTHKFRLMHDPRAAREFAGGSFRLATAAEWPASSDMCGGLLTIRPGELLPLHWHPNSNETNYFLRGKGQVLLYGSKGCAKVDEFMPGDVAYYPRGYGHAIRNVGTDELAIVQTWDSGAFQEIRLTDLLKASPRHLLANNFPDLPEVALERIKAS